MTREIIISSIIIYFIIAFVWYLIFTYQFTFRMRVTIAGETLQKDFKGLELAILCILWVIVIPFALKDLFKKNGEE